MKRLGHTCVATATLWWLATACGADVEQQKTKTERVNTHTKSHKLSPKKHFDFCSKNLFPSGRHTYFNNGSSDTEKGNKIKGILLKTLIECKFPPDGAEIDTSAYCCVTSRYYAYQVRRPNYCGFVVYTSVDDYDALELFTLNHFTKKLHKIVLAGIEWSGFSDDPAGQASRRSRPVKWATFSNDTTFTVYQTMSLVDLFNDGVKDGVRYEISSELEDTTHYYTDSIATRFTILPNGAFERLQIDSVRILHQGRER